MVWGDRWEICILPVSYRSHCYGPWYLTPSTAGFGNGSQWWAIYPASSRLQTDEHPLPLVAGAFATIAFLASPHVHLDTPKVRVAAMIGWITNLILYTGLTAAIAYRLWWANRRVSHLYTGAARYTPALHTIIESGSVFTTATVVVLCLSIVRNPGIIAATAPTTQLAVR